MKIISIMKMILFVAAMCPVSICFATRNNNDYLYNINYLTTQISKASTDLEKAGYLESRARNHKNNGELELAIEGYEDAVKINSKGWLWMELGLLYYKEKKYEESFSIAEKIKSDFPCFKRDGERLYSQSKMHLEILNENPVVILMDSKVGKTVKKTTNKEKKSSFGASHNDSKKKGSAMVAQKIRQLERRKNDAIGRCRAREKEFQARDICMAHVYQRYDRLIKKLESDLEKKPKKKTDGLSKYPYSSQMNTNTRIRIQMEAERYRNK